MRFITLICLILKTLLSLPTSRWYDRVNKQSVNWLWAVYSWIFFVYTWYQQNICSKYSQFSRVFKYILFYDVSANIKVIKLYCVSAKNEGCQGYQGIELRNEIVKTNPLWKETFLEMSCFRQCTYLMAWDNFKFAEKLISSKKRKSTGSKISKAFLIEICVQKAFVARYPLNCGMSSEV